MKIVPERVTVIPDAQRNELTVIMEGFRLSLTGEEARALSYALVQGVKQLSPQEPARAFGSGASATFAPKPAAPAEAPDATSKSSGSAAEVIRSLSA